METKRCHSPPQPTEAPAVVSAKTAEDLESEDLEPLSCSIGAELSNVNLGVASRDTALVAEIRALLLKYRVLFFRDQDITRGRTRGVRPPLR